MTKCNFDWKKEITWKWRSGIDGHQRIYKGLVKTCYKRKTFVYKWDVCQCCIFTPLSLSSVTICSCSQLFLCPVFSHHTTTSRSFQLSPVFGCSKLPIVWDRTTYMTRAAFSTFCFLTCLRVMLSIYTFNSTF